MGAPPDEAGSASWPKGISAITLFVEDLDAAKRFYGEVFGLPVHFEDDDSAVFHFRNTLINLLKVSAAPELIEQRRADHEVVVQAFEGIDVINLVGTKFLEPFEESRSASIGLNLRDQGGKAFASFAESRHF